MQHQGNYPVIWLTFKNVKSKTWQSYFKKICTVIAKEFKRHYKKIAPFLDDLEKEELKEIITKKASQEDCEDSLLDLSTYLELAYKNNVIILIDEYDSPIHAGYTYGYYDEVIAFMREFLGAGLKGNTNVAMSVLTGILRIAKESIFSGLNNLEVRTIFNHDYADKFGFLEQEVIDLLKAFGLEHKLGTIRSWYNGYQSGHYKIYNPWSILSLVKNRGIIEAYWVNTSENLLIRNLLKTSRSEVKATIEKLMHGEQVPIIIHEHITLPDINHDEKTLLNFLIFTGYLTFENHHLERRTWLADLKIPNEEIMALYETLILSWFKKFEVGVDYNQMLIHLISGNANLFKDLFEQFSYQTLSSFDVTGQEPERFYHALVLGMLVALQQTHDVRSNPTSPRLRRTGRESGTGRYDICITPKYRNKPGIIFEFKKVDTKRGETLEAVAQQALEQINQRDYEAEMRTQGIAQIIKLGIAFLGKESFVTIG